MNQKLSMIENEVSLGNIYTNEIEQTQEKEKIFSVKKDLYEQKL